MSSHHPLVTGIESWADRTPDATAVIEKDRTVTYAALREGSRRVAGALASLGIDKGARLTYLGKNSVEQVELTTGAGMLGAVAVPVNWRLSTREVASLVTHMEATVLVVQAGLLDLGRDVVPQCPTVDHVVVVGDGAEGAELEWTAWRDSAAPLAPEDYAELADDDVAAQLYTSGTSGNPKGVMLGVAGMRATVAFLHDAWALGQDAVLMPVLPWFHVGGIGAAAGALHTGGAIVAQNEVSGGDIIDAVERHGVTSMVVAPVMIQGVCAHPSARTADLSSLKLVSYGASPISPTLLREFLDLLPDTTIVQIYGMTETWGTITLLDGAAHHDADHPERLQSAGRAINHLEIQLRDPFIGAPVAAGEVGEVWVKYVGTMLGYFKQPELTAEVFSDDGYMRTNDLGWQDEGGFLFLCDRVGDMIVSGGENIFPTEVEDVIASHPQVAEVAVVGVAHPKWGETPKAYVVPTAGTTLEPDAVIEHARANLAHYKCPTSVEVVESLPRNPSGKLLRRVLRSAASDSAAAPA
ncbi:AMP-binding protein [Nocardioides sp. Y6]|uniref:AMP-binding protein n=1 Tax=Nocardioides malaquae TaxID=2773426 RepID=A0ABR9RT36_9ACTN|nr:AMP-binding protein [Nocardioides malaquae]MBE7324745.1 AMP-binding protein [Nocardioides malaquae]